MDFKKMAENYTQDSKEKIPRSTNFLGGSKQPDKDAEGWIDSVIDEAAKASEPQNEIPIDSVIDEAAKASESQNEIPKDQLDRLYDAAMKELMRLGLRPDGTVKIPNNSTQALSELEEGMPYFDRLKRGLDDRRALKLSLAISDLKEQLLPPAMWELYEKANKGGDKQILENLDGLLATAESFGTKRVQGKTLGEFRSDVLDLKRRVESKGATIDATVLS